MADTEAETPLRGRKEIADFLNERYGIQGLSYVSAMIKHGLEMGPNTSTTKEAVFRFFETHPKFKRAWAYRENAPVRSL